MDYKGLNSQAKKIIIKAFQEGRLNKEILQSINIEEVSTLLSESNTLRCIKIWEGCTSYFFNQERITEQEYNRLKVICEAIGVEPLVIAVQWKQLPMNN